MSRLSLTTLQEHIKQDSPQPCRSCLIWFIWSRFTSTFPCVPQCLLSLSPVVVVPCRNATDVINPKVLRLQDPRQVHLIALIVGQTVNPVDSRKQVDTVNLSMFLHSPLQHHVIVHHILMILVGTKWYSDPNQNFVVITIRITIVLT